MTDPRVLVRATCNGCGFSGMDWLSPMADLATLRCPKCQGTSSTATELGNRKLTQAEENFVRWLAREAIENWAKGKDPP